MTRDTVAARLLRSPEPSIRWKARVNVLGEDPRSRALLRLQGEVRDAPRTRALRAEQWRPDRHVRWGVYRKWLGDHWAIATLADLGYPPRDPSLEASVRRVTDFWLQPRYFEEFDARTEEETKTELGAVPRVNGRYRRCASQQGNALFAATQLGHAPEACDRLAERLLHWEWPDGGWNCDRNPSADTSSFDETLTPMLGLYVYGTMRRKPRAREASLRASEVFLRRRLFRRVSDGRVMDGEFLGLFYPHYYHYDVLAALRVLSRMGLTRDRRCAEALDWLESKELATGGWPATRRHYDLPGETPHRGTDRVVWGGTGSEPNEWITVDALAILRAAGRYEPRAVRGATGS